jgi:Oxidoreductase FAD-binding domain
MSRSLRFLKSTVPAALAVSLYQLTNVSILSNAAATGQNVDLYNPPSPALDTAAFKSFKLVKIETLTHDTQRYSFELPHESDELGTTVASCILMKANVDGE